MLIDGYIVYVIKGRSEWLSVVLVVLGAVIPDSSSGAVDDPVGTGPMRLKVLEVVIGVPS